MYKNILLYLFFSFYIFQIQGQTLSIYEKESKFPIERVLVYNKSKNIYKYTDSNGKVDISSFALDDLISIQHISYINVYYFKKELKEIKYKLYLENASEQIPEVVLSASKEEENRTRIAEQIEVLTLHEIQERSPQTSADLLALTPGVKVQKSQFGGGSPILRGMESNRVLLVVDGVRLNNAIYRKGHLQNSITVSPNLLSRTEVLFGPSSIMYGSDALGGVIHYYTKKPVLSDNTYLNNGVFARYSSVNNEFTSSYTSEFSTKKIALLSNISYSTFGSLKMGENRNHGFDDWGLVPLYSNNTDSYYNPNPVQNSNTNVQRNTGYNQIDLLQKVVIPFSDKTELNINFQYSNSSNIPRFDKLNEYSDGNLRYAEWYYGPQTRILVSSQLLINPDKEWLKDGIITLAFQDIKESRYNRKFNSLNKYFREENVKVWSLNADFHIPLSNEEKRTFSYGLETSYNKVNSDAIGKILAVNESKVTGFSDTFTIQSRFPDGGSSYTNFAFYTDYRLDYGRYGTLNIGARYTNTLLKATWIDNTFIQLPDMDITSSNSALSGTIGYTYKPSKKWKFSSVISSGFRSPNIDDIGKIREKKGNLTVPNINLKPEYAYNAEIGILHNFNKNSWIGFNTYYTLLHHYIYRDTYTISGETELMYDGELATTYANVNKGNAYVVGGTFNLQTKISEQIKFKSSATYTKGETYDTDEPLSSIPPFFGITQLSYNINRWNLGVNWRFNAHKKASEYNIEEGIDNIDETPIINPNAEEDVNKYYGTPSWNTFNISAQYKLTQYLSFNLHLDNIFDIHYKEFASGISAPGRNISLAVNAHF